MRQGRRTKKGGRLDRTVCFLLASLPKEKKKFQRWSETRHAGWALGMASTYVRSTATRCDGGSPWGSGTVHRCGGMGNPDACVRASTDMEDAGNNAANGYVGNGSGISGGRKQSVQLVFRILLSYYYYYENPSICIRTHKSLWRTVGAGCATRSPGIGAPFSRTC